MKKRRREGGVLTFKNGKRIGTSGDELKQKNIMTSEMAKKKKLVGTIG